MNASKRGEQHAKRRHLSLQRCRRCPCLCRRLLELRLGSDLSGTCTKQMISEPRVKSLEEMSGRGDEGDVKCKQRFIHYARRLDSLSDTVTLILIPEGPSHSEIRTRLRAIYSSLLRTGVRVAGKELHCTLLRAQETQHHQPAQMAEYNLTPVQYKHPARVRYSCRSMSAFMASHFLQKSQHSFTNWVKRDGPNVFDRLVHHSFYHSRSSPEIEVRCTTYTRRHGGGHSTKKKLRAYLLFNDFRMKKIVFIISTRTRFTQILQRWRLKFRCVSTVALKSWAVSLQLV